MIRTATLTNSFFSFTEELTEIAASLESGDLTNPAINRICKAIRDGSDPLGDAFIASRSAELRRETGTVYTPREIVTSMIAWAERTGKPTRIVDPGAGSGRFLMAAARAFPDAQLVAVEIDPIAVDVLKANLLAGGIADRTEIIQEDFRTASLPKIPGQTLFVGNPPYVRHHDIEPKWKDWFTESAGNFGQLASQLAGLHIYFFLRTLQLAKEGDYGAFVTSAEWLDVNYCPWALPSRGTER